MIRVERTWFRKTINQRMKSNQITLYWLKFPYQVASNNKVR